MVKQGCHRSGKINFLQDRVAMFLSREIRNYNQGQEVVKEFCALMREKTSNPLLSGQKCILSAILNCNVKHRNMYHSVKMIFNTTTGDWTKTLFLPDFCSSREYPGEHISLSEAIISLICNEYLMLHNILCER